MHPWGVGTQAAGPTADELADLLDRVREEAVRESQRAAQDLSAINGRIAERSLQAKISELAARVEPRLDTLEKHRQRTVAFADEESAERPQPARLSS